MLLLADDPGPVLVLGSDGILSALAEAGIPVTEDPLEATALLVGLDFGTQL